jgi:hypothetical protein
MTRGAESLAIGLALFYPAAQVVRLLDQIGAAIDPRFSVVGVVHEAFVPGGGLVPAVAAVLLVFWLVRRARTGAPTSPSLLSV